MEFLKTLGADMSLVQIVELMLRVILATVCGGIVGIERSRRFKDAGIRTHCMVACAAAVMMIISKYGFMDLAEGMKAADPARIAAQIVTGVGFLGAGMIYRDRHQSLKGLTTAAGLWCVAGIGMAAGAGLYIIAIFATVFILLLQFVMHHTKIGRRSSYGYILAAVIKDDQAAADRLKESLRRNDINVRESSVSRTDGRLSCVMEVNTTSRTFRQELSELIVADPDIYSIEFKDVI